MPSTNQAQGYVLNIVGTRRNNLLHALQFQNSITEPVPDFSHSGRRPILCFVSFEDDAITHISIGRRSQKAATAMWRLKLELVLELQNPIPYIEILSGLQGRIKPHVVRKFKQGGILRPKSFAPVVNSIRKLSPDAGEMFDKFFNYFEKKKIISEVSRNTSRSLAHQKETLSAALSFAGIDRKILRDWQPSIGSQAGNTFLDGFSTTRLHEDQMLINDMQKFPGFMHIKSTQYGEAVFKNNQVILRVVMANRLPLEQQTGADLIYYNETYKSFVFVQYKAMDHHSNEARFRLPNTQLSKELKRMEELWNQLCDHGSDSSLPAFRLAKTAYFLKLCPRIAFDPDDTDLVKGMYIPLRYWKRLEMDPSIKGPRGGRVVTYKNVGRYLNNTIFAELVAGGWIGTTTQQTDQLNSIIRTILQSGRTVTIASKRDLTPGEDTSQDFEEVEEYEGDIF